MSLESDLSNRICVLEVTYSVGGRRRYAFFTAFFQNFYNTDLLLGKRSANKPSRTAGMGQSRQRTSKSGLGSTPSHLHDFAHSEQRGSEGGTGAPIHPTSRLRSFDGSLHAGNQHENWEK
jgi:hypothetical protein